ncbi:hypothetical protein D3C87_1815180 [compost metagenome]
MGEAAEPHHGTGGELADPEAGDAEPRVLGGDGDVAVEFDGARWEALLRLVLAGEEGDAAAGARRVAAADGGSVTGGLVDLAPEGDLEAGGCVGE